MHSQRGRSAWTWRRVSPRAYPFSYALAHFRLSLRSTYPSQARRDRQIYHLSPDGRFSDQRISIWLLSALWHLHTASMVAAWLSDPACLSATKARRLQMCPFTPNPAAKQSIRAVSHSKREIDWTRKSSVRSQKFWLNSKARIERINLIQQNLPCFQQRTILVAFQRVGRTGQPSEFL